MKVTAGAESSPSLSLADVLMARDAYHVHLINQPHVAATAVGLYLARRSEAARPVTPAERLTDVRPGTLGPRTLENSQLVPWSWPCVLVFVDAWMSEDEIRENPDEMVPRRLYLPDGKVVPTCVVLAPHAEDPLAAAQHLNFPAGLVGGGFVCLSDVQHRARAGSIACLVSDGDLIYALTNRHVAGTVPGRELFTMADGRYTRIGVTAERSVGRLPFTDVYPGFTGSRMELALDAGLIQIDDLNAWTTQLFGIGRLEDVVDISPEALTLDLIGTPVRAFGAASGALAGQVLALYYRYTSRAGVEFLADVLIGPSGEEPLQTRPGDSGTLWVVEKSSDHGGVPRLSALAMEWGGERLARGLTGESSPYALATFVSNVCRALDVEVVYDWNADQKRYWGQVGHYTIGAKACELVDDQALRDFFIANRDKISFELADIEAGKYHSHEGALFYPLADVPDMVWKLLKGYVRGHEKPNHFADIDAQAGGSSLLSLYEDDPSTVTPERWLMFYRELRSTPSHMGLLPFRVAQLYGVIVDSLKAGGDDATAKALCAAGTMAHYVADACEPLHISQFADGRDESEKGVHEAYETKMIGRMSGEIIDRFDAAIAEAAPVERVTSGEVAAAVVGLMSHTVERLAPARICDVYRETHGDPHQMWDELGEATIDCMAAGCRTLAMLWASAWAEAGVTAPAAEAVDLAVLRELYQNPGFAPSMYLPEFVQASPGDRTTATRTSVAV